MMDQELNLEVFQQWNLSMLRLNHLDLRVVFTHLKNRAKAWVNSMIFRFELIWKLYRRANFVKCFWDDKENTSNLMTFVKRFRVWWRLAEIKPDWFDELKSFSKKKLNISLNINRSRIFLQIGGNDAGR